LLGALVTLELSFRFLRLAPLFPHVLQMCARLRAIEFLVVVRNGEWRFAVASPAVFEPQAANYIDVNGGEEHVVRVRDRYHTFGMFSQVEAHRELV
jgi:hypothetical protein